MQPQQTQFQPAPISNNIRRNRKIAAVVVVVAVVSWLIYFCSIHSFLSIQFTGAVSDDQKVVLVDQTSNARTEFTVSSGSFRKFVNKSQYEVFVSGQKGSAWLQTPTKGFLQNTSVSLDLVAEKERTFVADSPGGCMIYNQQLLSYNCDNTQESVTVHNASQGDLPPAASRGIGDVTGIVQGITNTSQGSIAFIQEESQDEELPGLYYSLVLLSPGSFQPASSQQYLDLDTDLTYHAKPYRGGLLVYDDDYTQFIYYADLTSKGVKISIPKVDDDLHITGLDSNDTSLVLLYSNQFTDNADSVSEKKPGTRSGVSVIEGTDKGQVFYFNDEWGAALLCGTKTLCVTTTVGERQQMIAYNISSATPTKLFAVNNVNQIFGLNGEVLAVTNTGVLRVNTAKRTGTVDLSFGNYNFCGTGLSQVPGTYIVCVTAKDGNHVLLINTKATDINHIDRKIDSLRATAGIDTIIVDRSKIFIVPNYGDTVYNPEEAIFDFDPAKVAAVDATINATVVKLQLKELGFTVINAVQ